MITGYLRDPADLMLAANRLLVIGLQRQLGPGMSRVFDVSLPESQWMVPDLRMV